ncbi:MAG: MraY family glycosyltransferase [Pseudomonadota bacterium]
MLYLSTTLTSIFITISLVPLLRKFALRFQLVDIPNARKVHCEPMPKSGGLAMAIGFAVPILFWMPADGFVVSLLAGAGVIVTFGLLDDIKDLGYKPKLAGQLIAALLLCFFGDVTIDRMGDLLPDGMILPGFLSRGLTLFVIVGVTNAINLSDGLDGLAGGISMLSFLCIGILGYQSEMPVIATLAFAVVGAIFGFLRFNTHPATVFMGDAGSQLLGFLAAGLSLKLCQGSNALSPSLPLIILGFPILDTLTVMIERIRKGRSPFVADKNHFHHKLMRLGLFHSEAVFAIYVLQSMLILFAFFFRFHSDWLLVLFYALFSGSVLGGIRYACRAGWQFKREGFLDVRLKRRLKVLRDRDFQIIVPFWIVEWCLPVFFLAISLLPATSSRLFGGLYLGWAAGMLLVSAYSGQKGKELGIRLFQFFLIPVMLLRVEIDSPEWLTEKLLLGYHLMFLLIAVLVIFIVKNTRRKKGFHASTMDYLILFVSVFVPLLPLPHLQQAQLIRILPQIIVLFFSIEVLLGELRGNYTRSCRLCVMCMFVAGIKSVFWG